MEIGLIILAGGKGSRIKPVIGKTPKLLAPITGRPFLDWLMQWIANWGISLSDIYLAGGIGYDDINSYVEARYTGITTLCEPSPLGTYGAVLNTVLCTNNDHYLVINGDTLFSVDMKAFASTYVENGMSDPCIVLRPCRNNDRYGSYTRERDMWIYSDSKPGQAISMGMLLASRTSLFARFERIAKQILGSCVLNESLLARLGPLMIDRDFCGNTPVRGFVLPQDSQFIDIGTPGSYHLAQEVIPCMS